MIDSALFVMLGVNALLLWSVLGRLASLERRTILMSAALDRLTLSVTNTIAELNSVAQEVRDLAAKLADNPGVPTDDSDALNALADRLDASVSTAHDALPTSPASGGDDTTGATTGSDTLAGDQGDDSIPATDGDDTIDGGTAQPNTGINGPPPGA